MRYLAVLFLFAVSSFAQSTQTDVTPAEDFRIGIDDVLQVAVFQAPELSGDFRVNSSGFITMQYVGNVKAAGLSPEAVAKQIETAFGKDYFVDPRVTVTVKEAASQKVTVYGAVRVAGVYQIPRPTPLLEVLAKAGFVTDSKGKILVTHQANMVSIDSEELLQNGKLDQNILIYAGDSINVTTALAVATESFFVVGEVNHQGEVPMKPGKVMTVRQVIASVGGTTKSAKGKEAKIIRVTSPDPKVKPMEIPLNLDLIMNASADDPEIQANDILYVPSKRGAGMFAGALGTTMSAVITRVIFLP